MPSLCRRSGLLSWVALATVWVVWGSTYLGIRAAVATIPPLTMAGFRFLAAGALLFAIVGPRHASGEQRPTWPHIRSAMVIGALLLVGGNGLLSVGEKHLASGMAALIVATVPIWMVVINATVTRTRITKATMIALALGTVGVAFLMGGPGGRPVDVGSAAVVLVASVFWASGSIYARRAPLPSHALVVTSLEMLAGGLLLLIAGTVTGELNGFDLRAISVRSLVGLLWLILLGSMVAFSAYVYANKTLPNDTVATYAYVNPVVAVALGALIDQEPISANLMVGGAIIVSSVVIIISGHRRGGQRHPSRDPDRIGSATRSTETLTGADHDESR